MPYRSIATTLSLLKELRYVKRGLNSNYANSRPSYANIIKFSYTLGNTRSLIISRNRIVITKFNLLYLISGKLPIGPLAIVYYYSYILSIGIGDLAYY